MNENIFLQSINFQFMVLGYMQMVVKIYPNVLTFHQKHKKFKSSFKIVFMHVLILKPI